MDPAFPDIVGEWARTGMAHDCANDNRGRDEDDDGFVETFLLEIARLDIEATRAW